MKTKKTKPASAVAKQPEISLVMSVLQGPAGTRLQLAPNVSSKQALLVMAGVMEELRTQVVLSELARRTAGYTATPT